MGPRLTGISLSDLRIGSFVLACLIYGVFGSPTPDHLGWAEISVGALLVLCVGAGGVFPIFRAPKDQPFWYGSGQVFLIYGLGISLSLSVFYGHPVSQALRDLVPFLFLFLPVFLWPLLSQNPRYGLALLFCGVFIGVLFSLRSVLSRIGPCFPFCTDELLYLENMPTVLYAALILLGFPMQRFVRTGSAKAFAFLILCALVSLIPGAALVLSSQRASLGAVALYVLLIGGFYLYQKPGRMVPVVLLGLLFLLPLIVFLPAVFEALLSKTEQVGFNNRPEEAAAVWGAVAQNPFSLLFGLGWGAHFHSPAVGGVSVNFTHNFFTTMLLKCGVCGLILSFFYIAGLARVLGRLVFLNPVFGFALAAPFLIDITLYASFKSLDFGLTLLMISSSLLYFSQSESSSFPSQSSHASSDHRFHEPSLSSRARRDGAGFA